MPTPAWINVAANGQQQRVWQRSDSSVVPGIILVDANDNVIGYVTPGAGFTPASNGAVPTLALPHVANGTGTYDPMQGAAAGTLIASAPYTTTQSNNAKVNYSVRGVAICWSITAAPGGSAALPIFRFYANQPHNQGQNSRVLATFQPPSNAFTGDIWLFFGPDAAAITSDNYIYTQKGHLPRFWSVYVVAGDTSSWTYTVSYSLLP